MFRYSNAIRSSERFASDGDHGAAAPRFAGPYDTSRRPRLPGFSPAHHWRTADAGTEDTR
ncbi:hypothetical protein GCM10009577_15300 [Streptomyces javensis]